MNKLLELISDYKKEIKGAKEDPRFFATGISVVAHMFSPFIPAAPYNSRFIVTEEAWFGGGCDLTPTYDEKKVNVVGLSTTGALKARSANSKHDIQDVGEFFITF